MSMMLKGLLIELKALLEAKIMLIVLRSTRNIKSLFPLKEKVAHQSCVIYEGQCSCKLSYIGEAKKTKKTAKFVGGNAKILLEN